MAIPKSEKLQAESAATSIFVEGPSAYMDVEQPKVHGDNRELKQVYPLNDMIAIWVETSSSSLMLSDKDKYKNEGVVIGVGPLATQVNIGDLVLFPSNAPHQTFSSSSGFYEGERIILMSEKMLLMKLKTINFTLVNA